MKLQRLIEILENEDQTKTLPHGFLYPHSYRGRYDELAFEPVENVPIADMLATAKACVGSTFQGWKGGDFHMWKDTLVNIAKEGHCGEDDELTETRLLEMLGHEKCPHCGQMMP